MQDRHFFLLPHVQVHGENGFEFCLGASGPYQSTGHSGTRKEGMRIFPMQSPSIPAYLGEK